MARLAEDLAKFADPRPEDRDPEREYEDSSEDSQSGNELARAHYSDVGPSRFGEGPRVDAVKYRGSHVSRNNLESEESALSAPTAFSDSPSSEEDDVDSSSENSESDESNHQGLEVDEDAYSEDSLSEESVVGPQKSGVNSEVALILSVEQKQTLSKISQAVEADIQKGKAVEAQYKVYDALLDLRIDIQKLMGLSNMMSLQRIGTEGNSDTSSFDVEPLLELISETNNLRHKLLDMQPPVSKKRSISHLVQESRALDEKLSVKRQETLRRWSHKVRMSSGSSVLDRTKFKSLNQSAETQVSNVLADMERLVKRTRVNRSQLKIGDTVPPEDEGIFDDGDFYRLLLKDLVDRRMADSTSRAGSSLKWQPAKTKTRVDTKASKGRKLRYHVQEKIQGFDAPRKVWTWSDEQSQELYSSLLGQSLSIDDQVDEQPEVEVGEFVLYA